MPANPPPDQIARLEARAAELEEHLSKCRADLVAAQRAAGRYRSLVEDGLALICTHDLEGRIETLNRAAATALGYEVNELVGANIGDLISGEFREFFPGYLERVATQGVDAGVMRLVGRDGSERIWTYHNLLVEDRGGPPHVVGHAQDITALQQVRAELRAARRSLSGQVRHLTANLVESNQSLQRDLREARAGATALRLEQDRQRLGYAVAVRSLRASTPAGISRGAVEECVRVFPGLRASYVEWSDDQLMVAATSNRNTTTGGWREGARLDLSEQCLGPLRAGDRVVSEVVAFIGAPVRQGERVVGAICLHVEGPRTWSPREIDHLDEVAAVLSRALAARES